MKTEKEIRKEIKYCKKEAKAKARMGLYYFVIVKEAHADALKWVLDEDNA